LILGGGTGGKMTPTINIGSSLTPTVAANSGVLNIAGTANSNVTINVWPNATWNTGPSTGTAAIAQSNVGNAAAATATINVKNGATWNLNRAPLVLSNTVTSTSTLNIESGATVNFTNGQKLISCTNGGNNGVDYKTTVANVNVYGTLNLSGGTSDGFSWSPGGRGTDNTTIYSGGLINLPSGISTDAGNPQIVIKSGGRLVSSGLIRLARNGGNIGGDGNNSSAITVDGGTFDLLGGGLQLSHTSGKSALYVKNGGLARIGSSTSSQNISMPYDATARKSIVEVSGGRLTVSGALSRNGNPFYTGIVRTFTISGGEVNIRSIDGAATTSGPVITHTGGILSPACYIAASNSYNEVFKTDLNSSAATGEGTRRYTQDTTAATIQIDIAGTTQSNATATATNHYDYIISTMPMDIKGNLNVVFRNNFNLSIGSTNTFEVIRCMAGINFTNGTSTFNNVTAGKVPGYTPSGDQDGTFDVVVTNTSVKLTNYYSPNLAPFVSVTSPAYGYLGGATAITPTVTDESIGTVTYLWTATAPAGGSVVFNPNATSKNVTVTPSGATGDYTLTLTATDSGGKFSSASLTFRVYTDGCAAAKIAGTAAMTGDINADCRVNFLDFALMAGNWTIYNGL
jgi:hypothetical protein